MFLQTGEAESANAVCAGALDRHPEDANFLCLSARVLLKLKRFDEANKRIERALSIFPEFAIPHGIRGEVLLAQNRPAAGAAREALLGRDPVPAEGAALSGRDRGGSRAGAKGAKRSTLDSGRRVQGQERRPLL